VKKETGMLLLLLFILSVLGNAASKTKPSTTEFEPPQILKEGKWQLFFMFLSDQLKTIKRKPFEMSMPLFV
jgi:hypothetical protein